MPPFLISGAGFFIWTSRFRQPRLNVLLFMSIICQNMPVNQWLTTFQR